LKESIWSAKIDREGVLVFFGSFRETFQDEFTDIK